MSLEEGGEGVRRYGISRGIEEIARGISMDKIKSDMPWRNLQGVIKILGDALFPGVK